MRVVSDDAQSEAHVDDLAVAVMVRIVGTPAEAATDLLVGSLLDHSLQDDSATSALVKMQKRQALPTHGKPRVHRSAAVLTFFFCPPFVPGFTSFN
jgi:hypothetical protein